MLLERLEPRHLLAGDNTPPTAAGGWIDLDQTSAHVISIHDLNYSDDDDDPPAYLTVHSLPTVGTLELFQYPVYEGQAIGASDIMFGHFAYLPDTEAQSSYSTSFTFTVSDGMDSSSLASLGFNVDVTPNSPPTVSGSAHTIDAPQTHTLSLSDLGYSDPDGDPLQWITILNPPTYGTLEYYDSPVYGGEWISRWEIESGYLTYVPDPYAESSYHDTFSFSASDGYNDSSPGQIALSVNVTPNAPPTVVGSSHSIASGSSHTITLPDLGYSDPEGDPLQWITILSPPSYGYLEYYGSPVYGGEWIDAWEISNGYLIYRPDPYHGSAYQDSFTFTASDGYSDSAAAAIHFSVTAEGNTPPTTEDSFVTVEESGYAALTSAHFPFYDADGDAFSHITILSLPAGASLTYWGSDVTVGQTINVYELDSGALELFLSPSGGGNAAASFSFSVSDGIDSSTAAVLTATLEGSENVRPLTWAADLVAAPGKIAFFGLGTFPFEHPDGNPLSHVTIHAIPSGTMIVDASGNPLEMPAVITAAMLQEGEVGFLSDAPPESEFGIVFSVSDGQADSSHSVLTVTMVDPADLPPADSPPMRIDLNRLQGPLVVLADGYVPAADSPPTPEIVAGWLDGSNPDGSIEFHEDDTWTYTESFDLGPAFGFSESVGFTFTASGAASGVNSYSLTLSGIHDESAGDSENGEGSTPPDPPIPDAPLPPDIALSLQYQLDVTLDGDGNVVQADIAGHYHNSDYHALVDVPFGAEEGEEPAGDSGTYTIIIAGWTILDFDSQGTTVNVGDHVYFSYRGGGTYEYDPTADGSDPIDESQGGEGVDGEGGDGEGGDGEGVDGEGGDGEGGDGGEGTTATRSGSVSGTYDHYGLHIYQLTLTGRVLLDGTPDPLTLTDSWYDEVGFSFDGGGTYSDGDTTGEITEYGSDTFIDHGSIVLVLTGDDFTLTGDNTLMAFGHSYYFDSWETPIDSDEDGAALVGNSWGSLLIQDSYHDHFEFEIQRIEEEGDGGDPENPDPESPDPESDFEGEDGPTHRWAFVGGSFDDFAEFVDDGGYKASGTFETTAGAAADRGGETLPLDTPVSGTIEIGGNYRFSITLDAKGTLTPDEILWEVGTLRFYDASDSSSTIDTSGSISSGGLTGTITFYDHHETDFLRDLTFDLTDPDVPATGHGHDFVLSDTKFDQIASGSIQWDDMSGTQWAEISDHFFLMISVDYGWTDGDPLSEDDSGGEGDEADEAALAGWKTETADFLLIADASFDIGYDVDGYVTREGLSGQAGENAYQKGSDYTFLSLIFAPGEDKGETETTTSFNTHYSSQDYYLSYHDLSGDSTSEPIAPTEAVITGTAWDNGKILSDVRLSVSYAFENDADPNIEGIFSIRDESRIDTGFSGSGDYTRTDGDTTFSGTATHSESFLSENRLRLLYSLGDDGDWRFGPPDGPLDDYAAGRSYSKLDIRYDHSYTGTGEIEADAGNIQWLETDSGESGHTKYSMFFQVFGAPEQAPPAEAEKGDGGEGGDGSEGEGSESESGEGSDDGGTSGDEDDAPASPLPPLTWTYSGSYESDSSFLMQFSRDAVGTYDSGTLDGTISESFFFRVSAGHDEEYNVEPDGSLRQTVGENNASSRVRFSFDLDVSGDIGSDNPHSGGLTGTVRIQNKASGGFNFSLDEHFSPGGDSGTWTTEGDSTDWATFSALVDVQLSGSVSVPIGGVNTSVDVTYKTFTHASGISANRFTLDATRDGDQPPGDDDWVQLVGITLARSIARSENTKFGQSDGGMIDETTRTRNENSSWSALLGPETTPGEGQWGDGGKSVDDYFFSLIQSSQESEQLSFPLGNTGEMLTGESFSSSSQNMTVRSNEGMTFGDGPDAPRIDEELLGDLTVYVTSLPVLPPGAGTAQGPDPDDPDGEDDWATGNYGRMSVSNGGSDSSGFSLEGSYTIDAGGSTPAQAARSLGNHQSSGYSFLLRSRKDPETGEWKNTAGSRSTSSSWGDSDSFIVQGSWGFSSPSFSISGTFFNEQSESSSGSSGSGGELDPQSGTWSSESSNSHSHDVRNIRTSGGSGSYSHDNYGFQVSGTISVADEYRYISHNSISNIYADGVRSPESTGSRYTDLNTRWMVNTGGGGSDDRTITDSGPINNSDGEAIGSYSTTTTLDHSASENALRDFRTSDRTDWRFDLATGTLVPVQRVQVNSHVIDISMDRTLDTSVQGTRETNETIDGREHAYTGAFGGRTREKVESGRNSTRTVTSTTPLEGPGAGVTSVTVSGTTDVSYTNVDWLHSTFGNSRLTVIGPGYQREEIRDHDAQWASFDSVRSTSRIDGTGETRYHGYRTLDGHGWSGTNREQIEGEEPTVETHEMPLERDDDLPDSYDKTIPHEQEESVEKPTPYREPSGLQPTTPGAMGPGSISPPEDPSEIADLRNDVAGAASSGGDANAARDAYFTELAAGTEQLGGDGPAAAPSELAADYTAANAGGTSNELAADSSSAGAPNLEEITLTAARELEDDTNHENVELDEPDSGPFLESMYTPEQIRAIEMISLYSEIELRIRELSNMLAPTGTNWLGIETYRGSREDRLAWETERYQLWALQSDLWQTFRDEGLDDVPLDYNPLLGIPFPGTQYTGGILTHLREMDHEFRLSQRENHAIQSLNYELKLAAAVGGAWAALARGGLRSAARELGLEAANEITGEPIGILAAARPRISGALHATAPKKGDKIYRVYGGDARPGGASWTPVNPGNVQDFRGAAGLPSGGPSGANNTGRFVIEGTLQDAKKIVKIRKAKPLDGHSGGIPEYVIPNGLDNGGIKIDKVGGVNPEF